MKKCPAVAGDEEARQEAVGAGEPWLPSKRNFVLHDIGGEARDWDWQDRRKRDMRPRQWCREVWDVSRLRSQE